MMLLDEPEITIPARVALNGCSALCGESLAARRRDDENNGRSVTSAKLSNGGKVNRFGVLAIAIGGGDEAPRAGASTSSAEVNSSTKAAVRPAHSRAEARRVRSGFD